MLVQVKWEALEPCCEVLLLTLLLLNSTWLIRPIKEMKVENHGSIHSQCL